ncbi:hypothetical protein FSF65_000005, partial [Escherichia coli]|nr:hypothetical protein [Escherichia coli]
PGKRERFRSGRYLCIRVSSSSCALEGTVTRQIVPSVGYGNINIEHPSGALDVHLSNEGQDATTLRASVIRTTRKIFSGEVYLP